VGRSFLIQHGFRKNRTSAVAGAQKQHVAGHRCTLFC
jgi:hypothetical protein